MALIKTIICSIGINRLFVGNWQTVQTLKYFAFSIKSILAGVPQGLVLGSVLFLIYINDIAKQLLSLTRLFADDSSLFYAAARLTTIIACIINHDLVMRSNWAILWLVKVKPLKLKRPFYP